MPMMSFTCPRCGITQELPLATNRKLCPSCAEEKSKARSKEYSKKFGAELREHYAIKQQMQEAEKQKAQALKTQKEHDTEVTDRIKKQIKLQCHKCFFWNRPEGAKTGLCDYYLRYGIGHRVDHGNGPGDCRCFQPKRKKTKEERVERSRIILAQSEADHAG